VPVILLRRLLGDVLRRHRQGQGRTLREVSKAAKVSLGYLSEVERGQKEASSELLASICEALGVRMSEVFREVSDRIAIAELTTAEELRSVFEQIPAPQPDRVPSNPDGSVRMPDAFAGV
jgi:transcriptional regulator with XRE-family HTH domain